MDVEIREMDISDLSQIVQIENESFVAPWSKDDIIYELNESPISHLIVATINNVVVGFCDYWITYDSATIAQIAVDSKFRRMKIATKLLEEVVSDCYAKRALNITLEVRLQNENAIKLYEKNGFARVLVKPKYYTNGDDALYMLRKVEM